MRQSIKSGIIDEHLNKLKDFMQPYIITDFLDFCDIESASIIALGFIFVSMKSSDLSCTDLEYKFNSAFSKHNSDDRISLC